MPSEDAPSAQEVLNALTTLAAGGFEGLAAANNQDPRLFRFLIKQVREILATSHPSKGMATNESLPPSDVPPKGEIRGQRAKQGNRTQLTAASGTKPTSLTRQLVEEFGGQEVTNMTRFVIMQHIAIHPKETTVQTVVDELVAARLSDETNRSSIVTSLNRLKNVSELITWPEGVRGREITLTDKGKAFLTELINRKLQKREIEYLFQNAPASIKAHLSPVNPA